MSCAGWTVESVHGPTVRNILIFPIKNTETDRKSGPIILIISQFGGSCAMQTLFPPGMGRLGTILAFGLAFWAAAGAGRAIADDPPGCGDPSACACYPVFWQGYEPLPACPWYVSSDGIAMQRLFRGLGPIATEGPNPAGTFALSQQDLPEPFNAGAGCWWGTPSTTRPTRSRSPISG